ncbi:MAG: hypothetical protein K2Y22_10430 [Candidatus Obscuribacterales bacterium]|nr:hypothetical protein [Candidatus Obscuribacterales bacterium]
METVRSCRGNALILLIVSLMFALVVGFIVINYTMLFTSHKEAQTAIDAGALQAAKDLGRIVVSEEDGTYFGNVALVDDSPPDGDINKRPVIGINTIMATIRLDALIANELGNSSMVVMAAQDLRRAEHDAKLLRNEILKAASGGTVKDKNGKEINLVASANIAYDANAVRAIKGAKRRGDLHIKVGTTNGKTKTNTPVPVPITSAQVDGATSQVVNGDYVYTAGVNVDTNAVGTNLTFRFIATGGTLALVDNNTFQTMPSDDLMPPSLVQVDAQEDVGLVSTGDKAGSPEPDFRTVHVIATAEAGSSFSPKGFPSGTLQVSFPGAGAPPSGFGVDFTSIKSIMNNSQVKLDGGKFNTANANLDSNFGSTSPYHGWNQASPGNWFRASGGPVPANASASVIPDSFRGRNSDDPSVVLSFVVYDWLRSMYLRPNIKEAADVISSPLWNQGQQATLNNSVIAPVYADVRPDHPVTFGIFDIPQNGVGDRRDLRNFHSDREGYRRQFPNVFGYIPADMTLPGNSLVVSLDNQGRTITTNGQPAEILFDFYNSVKRSNQLASESLKAAKAVLIKKVDELDANKARIDRLPDGAEKTELLKQRKAMLRQVARALAVSKNAQYTINATVAMLNDRKAITAFGLKRESGKKYEIVTGNFYPVQKAATEAEIISTSVIATNQDESLAIRDWACPSVKPDKSFVLVSSSGAAKISEVPRESGLHLLAPAHALTAVPPQRNNIFALYVNPDGHMVRMTPLTSLAGVNVLETQYMYQNTASWVTKPAGSSITQVWNCIARDNGAVYTKAYFADRNAPGSNASLAGNNYPVLIGEWSLRCPAPTSGPIPTTPSITPPGIPAPPPTSGEVPGTPTTPPTPPTSGEVPGTPTPPSPPTAPPTSPPTPPTPPTTPEGPNFCVDSMGPTGRVTVEEGDSWGSVVAKVDSSGNVHYFMKMSDESLKEMHFLSDFETWKSAVTTVDHNYHKNPGGNNRDRSIYFPSMDEAELRDYFESYGQPPSSTGVAAGTYQKEKGSVDKMDDEIVDLLFSTYRAAVFYIEEGGCAKLFHFST